MGCPRHLQWSPVKEESVALSSQGFKRKETDKRKGVCSFSSSSSFSNTLSPRVSRFRNVVRRFSFQAE